MTQIWIPLKDIPAEGGDITVAEQAIWLEPIGEFRLPYRVQSALSATLHITPQEDGCLVHGHLTGGIAIPCDRCAEESLVTVDQRFSELFSTHEELREPGQEATIRAAADGQGMEIEVAALLWEEFLISLPVKPLCKEDCKGLCPICGADRNKEQCDCKDDSADPRLAVLQNLKITR